MPHFGFPLFEESIHAASPKQPWCEESPTPGRDVPMRVWASAAIIVAALFLALILHAAAADRPAAAELDGPLALNHAVDGHAPP